MTISFELEALHRARNIVAQTLSPTPQICWPLLSERAGAEVWVKHENHLPTGAFKVRGGLTYLERCQRERPSVRGLVCATRGNHGQSIALAARHYGVPATIVVPRGNNPEKNAAMRAYGADLIEHGDDFEAASREAQRLAEVEGWERVPSFHPDLVLGVATYAFELFTTVPRLDVLYVSIGLGSGICGCIRVRDLLNLPTRIIGVQAAGAAAYAASLAAGHAVSIEKADTFADGVATRTPDPEALAFIRTGVERIVTVDDEAIAAAIRHYWTDTHNLAEGAGAAPLAALLQERHRMAGQRVGLVLSGGNIDLPTFFQRVAATGRN